MTTAIATRPVSPWKSEGAAFKPDSSTKEILKASGLDWNAVLRPLRADMGNGKSIEVPKRYALVRDTDNKILTLTGPSWKPVQNATTIDFMRDFVKAGGAELEGAGMMRNGRIVWGLAKLKHTFEVRKGDKIGGNLLFISPHEVGRKIQIRTTSRRFTCENMLPTADHWSNLHYAQSHVIEFNSKAARTTINKAIDELGEAERRYKTIAKLKISINDAVRKVFVPVFHPDLLDGSDESKETLKKIMIPEHQPKTLSEIIDSLNNAPGAEPGTGWGVLNAVTHWADHVAGRNQSTRLYRSWVGDLGRDKMEVERLLLELAE